MYNVWVSSKKKIDGISLNSSDDELCREYLSSGYVIREAADLDALDWILQNTAEVAAGVLGVAKPMRATETQAFFNTIHERVTPPDLNDFRLKVLHGLNALSDFWQMYYRIAKPYLEAIVGNELAMQQRPNLSIQMPNDSSSLLPVHSDIWSGDSPYEVVVWLPLVDCFGTKAMYILPAPTSDKFVLTLKDRADQSSDSIYAAISENVEWLEIKCGQVLLFDQSALHGNIVNTEKETRWSMNCRFKGLFTPYGDKKLGEFFVPLIMKPASSRGLGYKLPELE